MNHRTYAGQPNGRQLLRAESEKVDGTFNADFSPATKQQRMAHTPSAQATPMERSADNDLNQPRARQAKYTILRAHVHKPPDDKKRGATPTHPKHSQTLDKSLSEGMPSPHKTTYRLENVRKSMSKLKVRKCHAFHNIFL
jgi:hypothetical protein